MQPIDAPMRVIAIDDDPFELKLIKHQLSRLGLRDVQGFTDATEALNMIEDTGPGAFDMIFYDLQMPGVDGIDLQRRLVRLKYEGHVVLFSGEDERTMQAAARLAERQNLRLLGILPKPIEPEALRKLIENAVRPERRSARTSRPNYPPDDLARGLAANELINYYQPKVRLSDGRPIEAECLVRWQHPQDGMVFPDQFIPVAEEHGLIDELTRAVLRTALRQSAEWRDQGLMLRVAVNISMDNLWALDFPEQVMAALEAARVPPENLILEVTESRLMQDPVAVLDILTRLRLKRVRLSIDDFGVGHSSLAQLRDLPFDELKIDRSFVHGAHASPQKRAILQASIGMARELGMRTIAEGVEDLADWNTLRAMGCDLVQGYFCARPMPGAQMPIWVEEWSERYLRLDTGLN